MIFSRPLNFRVWLLKRFLYLKVFFLIMLGSCISNITPDITYGYPASFINWRFD